MALHPLAEGLLRAVVQTGAKALGRAAESVLEDVGRVADGVSARTKQGRDKLENIGMGRPKPRSRKRRKDDEDE